MICLNRAVNRELAEAIVDQFAELVFAPGFDEDALEILPSKPQHADPRGQRAPHDERVRTDTKRVIGGLLVQDRDMDLEERSEMQIVTERHPERG